MVTMFIQVLGFVYLSLGLEYYWSQVNLATLAMKSEQPAIGTPSVDPTSVNKKRSTNG